MDIIIIGAGPIGLACGIEAAKHGLDYLILDKGCLVNSLYHYPANLTFFSTSEKIEIGGVPFVSHLPRPNRSEALEYYRRVAQKWDLEMNLYEEVIGMNRVGESYEVETKKACYQTKAVVIATGFYDHPNRMGVAGEDLPKVAHYYQEPHPYIGHKVAIIGGGNSGVDAALECWRKGVEVSLLIRGGHFTSNLKYWIRPDIENRMKAGEIDVHFHTQVLEIGEDYIEVVKRGEVMRLENDFVLAMTGYHPDFEWLQKLGIELDERDGKVPVYDEETLETNLPNVFLAGTVCGGSNTSRLYIENTTHHGELIVGHLMKAVLCG